MNWDAISALVSLIVGIGGGVIGAYVGMRVGLVRLETWKDIAAKNLTELDRTTAVLNEDSLMHDMEIGDLMQRANLVRVRRQRLRE